MLLALSAAARASEICNLAIRYLVKHASGYTFTFSKLSKTRKQGKPIPSVNYFSFPEEKHLCVCHNIDMYLKRSEKWRGDENQLLLSYIKPHKTCSNMLSVSVGETSSRIIGLSILLHLQLILHDRLQLPK